VTAMHTGNVTDLVNGNAGCAQFANQRIVVAASQCRVCFSGGAEIRFDSEMELHPPTDKPCSAAIGKPMPGSLSSRLLELNSTHGSRFHP